MIAPALDALLRANSDSALQGTNRPPIDSTSFFNEENISSSAISALFAAIYRGNIWRRIVSDNKRRSFDPQMLIVGNSLLSRRKESIEKSTSL